MSVGVASGRHLQALLGSLGRLIRSPLASFLTLLVIALALALPAALKLFVTNAQAATGNFASAVDVSVYLKTDVPLAKAQQLAQAAQQRPDVATVTLISADKGLEAMRSRRSRRTRCRMCCTYARAPRRAPPPGSIRCGATSRPGRKSTWCRSTRNG
jgi:hypothetical protein